MTRAVPVATVLALLLLVTGCAGADQAPPPATPAGYQSQLDRTDHDLADAFDAIRRAPTPDLAARAALAAAGVASAAGERLAGSDPPAPVAADNAALAEDLRRLGHELAYLSQQVNLHAICTGTTAAAAIGTAPSMAALRAVAASLAAERPDRPAYHWGAALPPPTDAAATERPLPNGSLVADRRTPGRPGDGALEVRNEGGSDAVVTLASGGAPVVSMAVSAGRSARLDGIADGDYDLYYTTGRAWDAGLGMFSRYCVFRRFTGPAAFHSRVTPAGAEYTVQAVTIRDAPTDQPPDQPDADTAEIPPTALPH